MKWQFTDYAVTNLTIIVVKVKQMSSINMNLNNNNNPTNTSPNQHQLPHQQLQRQNDNSFKIAYWNAAGVANKIPELESFIHMHNLDAMMIVETKLNPNQPLIGRTTLENINGYNCYLTTRPSNSRSGGVAILVKSNLKHMALQPISFDQIQCAPVAISLDSEESVILAPIYCPPQTKWTEEQFSLLLDHLHIMTNNRTNNNYNLTGLIICGDWNAKHRWWGNIKACHKSKPS